MRNAASSDHFVLTHRPPKQPLDPRHAYASTWEEEVDRTGRPVPTAVVFLTNRECPFHCVMCDLWRNTVDEPVPRGAIPGQIRRALSALPAARQIKLYNAGSFFDPRAIPPDDDEEIAEAVSGFDRVIVEAHPSFLLGTHGARCLRFRDRLPGRLEVAIGLETAHPGVLAQLNKQMTLDSFGRAAAFLRDHDIDLRVFVLLGPPFMPPDESVDWACRSIDVAMESGATVCTVIPTRGGNGAMEALPEPFVAPRLGQLEAAVEFGVSREGSQTRMSVATKDRMRVFADLWDVERLFDCACSSDRAARLRVMNREQRVPPPVVCACDDRY